MTPTTRLSRVLLYSHDTYGLGHLRRNLVIATELLNGPRPPQVVLASGSPVIDQVPRPAGLICVQLPPVVKTGDDEYRAVDPTMSLSLVRRARTAVLLDVVRRWTPDVFLVDHAPQGMKGELLPVFDELPRVSPGTKIVLGMRDILDEPARVQQAWRDAGVYETLASVYDRILVYGDQAVFDLVRKYRIPSSTADRLDYCGYVTGDRAQLPVPPPGLPPGAEYVLGTIGGGGDGSDVLVATARAAVRSGIAAVLCTGPLMPASDRERLVAATQDMPSVVVVDHLREPAAVAAGARCVVTRAATTACANSSAAACRPSWCPARGPGGSNCSGPKPSSRGDWCAGSTRSAPISRDGWPRPWPVSRCPGRRRRCASISRVAAGSSQPYVGWRGSGRRRSSM